MKPVGAKPPARRLDPGVKETILSSLSSPYGGVKLRIDGRDVTVQMERVSKSRLVYGPVVYIDGHIKGEWFVDCPEFVRKVWRRRTLFLWPERERKKLRRLKVEWIDVDASRDYWCSDWPSGAAFVRALERNGVEVALQTTQGEPQ